MAAYKAFAAPAVPGATLDRSTDGALAAAAATLNGDAALSGERLQEKQAGVAMEKHVHPHGMCMACAWHTQGLPMVYPWRMHGVPMAHAWDMHGRLSPRWRRCSCA